MGAFECPQRLVPCMNSVVSQKSQAYKKVAVNILFYFTFHFTSFLAWIWNLLKKLISTHIWTFIKWKRINHRNRNWIISNFYQLHMVALEKKTLCYNNNNGNKCWQNVCPLHLAFKSIYFYLYSWFRIKSTLEKMSELWFPVISFIFPSCSSSWEIYSYVPLTTLKDGCNYIEWSQHDLLLRYYFNLLLWIWS